MEPNKIIESRQGTHGSFAENARLSQSFLELVATGHNFNKLTHVQKESLHMTLHKISRILSGDNFEDDHWNDGGNYMHLSVKFNHGRDKIESNEAFTTGT